jgi:hypothetical protein
MINNKRIATSLNFLSIPVQKILTNATTEKNAAAALVTHALIVDLTANCAWALKWLDGAIDFLHSFRRLQTSRSSATPLCKKSAPTADYSPSALPGKQRLSVRKKS